MACRRCMQMLRRRRTVCEPLSELMRWERRGIVHLKVEEQTRLLILLRAIGHAQVSSVGTAGEACLRGGGWRAVCDGERAARLVGGDGREGEGLFSLRLPVGRRKKTGV